MLQTAVLNWQLQNTAIIADPKWTKFMKQHQHQHQHYKMPCHSSISAWAYAAVGVFKSVLCCH